MLDVAGSTGEAVEVGVEGLGLEFPPRGPLWVTVWALSLYRSWVKKEDTGAARIFNAWAQNS